MHLETRSVKKLRITVGSEASSLSVQSGRGQNIGRRYVWEALSDRGGIRQNNEDSILSLGKVEIFESVEHARVVCAVTDGVGGTQKGELASRVTIKTLGNNASKLFQSDLAQLEEGLKTAIEEANTAVVKYAMEHRESEGMATTIVASIIDETTAFIAHVGDSRAYLVNQNQIRQLTKDHSQVQELVDAGKIRSEQIRHYRARNVITRAVGSAPNIDVTVSRTSIGPGDRLLLCTDGLWEPVSDREMQQIIMQSPDPRSACESLVSLANKRGGKDNISLLIVEVRSSETPHPRISAMRKFRWGIQRRYVGALALIFAIVALAYDEVSSAFKNIFDTFAPAGIASVWMQGIIIASIILITITALITRDIVKRRSSNAQISKQICPRCHTELAADSDYCLICGTKQQPAITQLFVAPTDLGPRKTCRNCGAPIKSTAKYCNKCGSQAE